MLRNLLIITMSLFLFQACSSDDDNGMTDDPIISDPVLLDAEVGGPDEPHVVYIDLPTATQTIVNRDSWDLGFYSGDDGYYVILNQGAYVMAQPLEINDMTEVTAEDTVGMIEQMDQFAIFNAVLEDPRPNWLPNSVNWIDNSNGNLSETAFEAVVADGASNPVHIVNRGWAIDDSPRGWLKVRVLRSGNGYELQYAEIDSESFESVQIEKSASHNFTFYNFDRGVMNVEPPKDEWQIAFHSGLALFRFAGVFVPYAFRDYVIHNRYDVEIAEVLYDEEDNVDIVEEYNNLRYEDVFDLDFQSEINTIGSDWRTVGNPQFGGETQVNDDRFYVVRDAEGNYFKLIFAGMLSETGERGHPSIQYELLEP